MAVLKWIAWIGGGLATTVVVAALLTWYMVSAETRAGMTAALIGPYNDNRDWTWHTSSGEELIRANSINYSIATKIAADCFPNIDLAAVPVPAAYTINFMLGVQPNGDQSWNDDKAAKAEPILLTNYQRSVLFLSQTISSARAQLASSASDSQRSMYFYQFLIVLLGAATTIFVSVKSTISAQSRISTAIGILAVVFSAAGTAASSLNSFVGPNEAYIRAERGLMQLRQLHTDLVFQVQSDNGMCNPVDFTKADDLRVKRIADLASRFKDIFGSAGVGGAAPAGSNTGSSTTAGAAPSAH